MRVLVTGATGFVGRRLVAALLAETSHDVTVLVRDAASYEPPASVTVVEGDVLERVSYLSGLGSEGDALSSHLASRREVETLLQAGSADVTVLRAAIIIGDGSASFRLVRQLATRLPVMVTPQWVDTDSQPIAIDDVIAYCLAVLERPETAGETYEIGGPDVLTYRKMLIETAEIATGHRPLIVSVPVLSPRLSAHWVGLVTDVPREVAYPLIDGVRNRVVVTDDRLERLVDIEPTPFDVAVRRA